MCAMHPTHLLQLSLVHAGASASILIPYTVPSLHCHNRSTDGSPKPPGQEFASVFVGKIPEPFELRS